jgi:hypothetical protein
MKKRSQQFSVCFAEKRRDTIEIFQGSCQGIKGPPTEDPFSPGIYADASPGSFFGVPSRSVKRSITGSSREREEKIRQIKDNLPDFGGCKEHLFEMENCCEPRVHNRISKKKRALAFPL